MLDKHRSKSFWSGLDLDGHSDEHSLEWLNAIIQLVYPRFNKAMQADVLPMVQQEVTSKAQALSGVSAITITSFDFGETPPVVGPLDVSRRSVLTGSGQAAPAKMQWESNCNINMKVSTRVKEFTMGLTKLSEGHVARWAQGPEGPRRHVMPNGAGKGQQHVLRDKDLVIARLSKALQESKGARSRGAQALRPEAEGDGPDQTRLAEIAVSPRQLGLPADRERDGIKGGLVSSKPRAARAQHWATRVGALRGRMDKRDQATKSIKQQRAEVAQELQEARRVARVLANEWAELEVHRRSCYETLVPALDLPVGKLGDLLAPAGADGMLRASVAKSFEALRDLEKKAEGGRSASSGAQLPPPRQRVPSREGRVTADATAVPMGAGDLEELDAFHREFLDSGPLQEEGQIMAAVKHWATAADNAKRQRKTAREHAAAAGAASA
ncbi:unnamed protein product [Prorocentrum cordatum]|nr:unnamed protein product [Polarella glacialis]